MCFNVGVAVPTLRWTCCVRYHLIFIGQDRCQEFDELRYCDLLILEDPFHISLEKWSLQPSSYLSPFKVFKERFYFNMSICCKVILKFFFTFLIYCLHLTALLYGISCSNSSFSSLSEISSCSFLHFSDAFWVTRPLMYPKRSRGESFLFNLSVF